MLADDHALVDLGAGLDHHRAAILQVPHGIGHGLALVVGDQDAVAAARHLALERLVGLEQAVHDRRAAGVGHQLALVADKAASGRVEDEAQAVASRRLHLDHLGLALGHLLHDDARILLVDVDHDLLDRLQDLAGLVLRQNHAGARDRDLEALAAHGLDQDGELQFAPARDVERVLVVGLLDLQRDVALALLEQAVADHAARDLVALGARERRVVDDERHGDGGRIDRLGLDRGLDLWVAEGVGHRALHQSGDRDDVARLADLDRGALQAAEGQDLRDAAGFHELASAVDDFDRLVRLHGAGRDAPGDDATEEGVGFEQRAEHPERTLLDARLRHVLEDEVEQRREAVLLRAVRRGGHPAGAAGAIEDREVELVVGGVERGEQVEDLVDDFRDAGVRPVDLVDRHDRLQPDLERLADHELGLRHRTLGRVDEHDDAVDHREDALDLAAEIGVARRVDDVDAGVLPDDRGRLGEDGDAALLLEVVRVHRPFLDPLVVAEGPGLRQELVDERRLAVVDVGDDGDVAQLHGVSEASRARHATGCGNAAGSAGSLNRAIAPQYKVAPDPARGGFVRGPKTRLGQRTKGIASQRLHGIRRSKSKTRLPRGRRVRDGGYRRGSSMQGDARCTRAARSGLGRSGRRFAG